MVGLCCLVCGARQRTTSAGVQVSVGCAAVLKIVKAVICLPTYLVVLDTTFSYSNVNHLHFLNGFQHSLFLLRVT